jgi:hypothetical protein
MECMVHGCSAEATEEVEVYPNRVLDIHEGHGSRDLKAKVCPDHNLQYVHDGYLGGLVVADDPEAYAAENKPHRDRS